MLEEDHQPTNGRPPGMTEKHRRHCPLVTAMLPHAHRIGPGVTYEAAIISS